MDQICPKGVILVPRRNEQHHWILHNRISWGTKFQLKLQNFDFLDQIKGYFRSKKENHTFSFVHRCYLLYKTFPHGGRQTQRYFNVSPPASRRGKYKEHSNFESSTTLYEITHPVSPLHRLIIEEVKMAAKLMISWTGKDNRNDKKKWDYFQLIVFFLWCYFM